MNIFENLFNKKQKDNEEKDKETNNLKIINELRENIDLIEKRNLFIEKHKDKLIIEAKAKLNNNDKKGALLILNKKKKIEEFTYEDMKLIGYKSHPNDLKGEMAV